MVKLAGRDEFSVPSRQNAGKKKEKKRERATLSGRSLKSDLDFVITSDVIGRRF